MLVIITQISRYLAKAEEPSARFGLNSRVYAGGARIIRSLYPVDVRFVT
jgi:hypothetical protein